MAEDEDAILIAGKRKCSSRELYRRRMGEERCIVLQQLDLCTEVMRS